MWERTSTGRRHAGIMALRAVVRRSLVLSSSLRRESTLSTESMGNVGSGGLLSGMPSEFGKDRCASPLCGYPTSQPRPWSYLWRHTHIDSAASDRG